MKIRELRELAPDELRAKETELRDQLFKLRFQKSLGQLDSPMKLRTIKRDIARIRTVLHEMAEKAA
jgi:large subunit ribosomal protein L29